jgi:hypothetical protein
MVKIDSNRLGKLPARHPPRKNQSAACQRWKTPPPQYPSHRACNPRWQGLPPFRRARHTARVPLLSRTFAHRRRRCRCTGRLRRCRIRTRSPSVRRGGGADYWPGEGGGRRRRGAGCPPRARCRPPARRGAKSASLEAAVGQIDGDCGRGSSGLGRECHAAPTSELRPLRENLK